MQNTIIILALFLTSCSILKQPAANISFYRLDYQPAYTNTTQAAKKMEEVLMIKPFSIDAIYDRNAIMYMLPQNQCGYYNYHQWITNPSGMITDLFTRDFRQSDLFKTVLSPNIFYFPDYSFNVQITTLSANQVQNSNSFEAIFEVCATLVEPEIDSKKTRIVFEKNYKAVTPIQSRLAVQIVDGMNKSIQTVSSNIIMDVYLATKQTNK